MSIPPHTEAQPLITDWIDSQQAVSGTRPELLRWFVIILAVVASANLVVLIFPLRNWSAALVAALLTGAGALAPAVHRWTGSLAATTHYFAAIIFTAVLSVATFTGGLFAPVMMWLVTIPMVAMMLNGPRSGVLWLGVVVLEVVLVCLIAPTEFAQAQTLTPYGYRLLTVVSLVGMSASVLACLLVDYATLSKANRSLHYFATRDELTQLLNRRVLLSLLQEHITAGTPQTSTVSLIMFDVDHFKSVNDRFGHAVGDLALQELAHRATGCLRASDHVGRYGGEEFLCVLPNCPLDNAWNLAESIRRAIEAREFDLGEIRIPLSISLGVAAYDPERDGDGMDALRRADRALYIAKERGRNQTCVDLVPKTPRSISPNLPTGEILSLIDREIGPCLT